MKKQTCRNREAGRAGVVGCFVLLLAACSAGFAWAYVNPSPVINPPTTWATPSDGQLQQWQQQVQLVSAWHDGFFSNGLRDHGSGFFVTGATLITALHVIKDVSDVNSVTIGATSSTTKLSPSHELVAEDVDELNKPEGSSNQPTLPVSSVRPARGQHLWLLCATGSNTSGVYVSEFSVVSQSTTATLSGPSGTTQYVQDEIAMTGGAGAPGCSGAPVVDGSGAVVGMADGGLCSAAGPACQLDAVPSAVFAPK